MGRNPQSHMKRARELELKERRERKREKKAARAESRDAATGDASPTEATEEVAGVDAPETAVADEIPT